MKRFSKVSSVIVSASLIFLSLDSIAQTVGIGASAFTPNSASILDVSSSTKGVLLPRMTSAERGTYTTNSALGVGHRGITVYNTTTNTYDYWDGAAWKVITPGALTDISAGNGLSVNYGGAFPKVELGGDLEYDTQVRSNNFDLKYVVNSTVGGGRIAIGSTSMIPDDLYSMSIERPGDNNTVKLGGDVFGVWTTVDAGAERAIYGENTSTSAGSAYWAVGGQLVTPSTTNGYLGYHTTGNNSYAVYGNGGTYAGYFSGATWGVYSGGKTVVTSSTSPTSVSDFEVQNTTSGAGNPATISIRQTTSNAAINSVLANLNFGDNYATGAQARIQVLRSALGDVTDLPTDMLFFTTPDASTTMVERMRITEAGVVRVANLAGTGSRMVLADPSGNLSAPSGAATANTIYIQNQSAAQQATSTYWISGNGRMDGALTVGAGATLDNNNTNTGTSGAGALVFGNASGEGIASKRNAGGNQYGLDFYTASTNRLAITSAGSIGVGTSAPQGILHVVTTQTGNAVKLHNTGLGNGSLVGLEFGKANSNNNMVEFRYNHVSDANAANYVNLGLWGNANSLVVQGSGNVGIGTNSPSEAFSVYRAMGGWQSRFNNNSGTGADVYLAHGGGYGIHVRGWNSSDAVYTMEMYNNSSMTNAFYNSGRVVLGMVGNVGVGIATPGYKLDVTGSARISQNNATGGGLFLADDGSMVDNNDGYASMRFSSGVSINAGQNNNTQRILLRSDGNIQLLNNTSPTVNFNDSDNPDYYLHANSDRLYFLHGDGYNSWNGNRPLTLYQGNKVGINAETPNVSLAVGGGGTNVYNTDAWIENNIHVQGNEALSSGGRGRLRVGTAWGYVGLYAEASSTGAANDLVLGAGSGLVRIGPNAGNQRLYLDHNTKSLGGYAIYNYNGGSVNAGNGYGIGNVSAGIKAYHYYGNTYDFAMAGYSYNDYNRSGGIIGGNQAGGSWEAAGYRNSGGTLYGEYYTSTASGGGYLPQGGQSAGIGSGGFGDFMGAWTRGGVVGHIAAGEAMASYNLGDEYTSGRQIEIVEIEGKRALAYVSTSIDPVINKSGIAELTNGVASILFEPDFAKMISKGTLPVVTVTPMGECNGIFLTSVGADGFTVKELNSGSSNVRFSWIVMAERVDGKVQGNVAGVMSREFDTNLKEALFDENNRERNAMPMWWDGQTIRFEPIPDSLHPVKKK